MQLLTQRPLKSADVAVAAVAAAHCLYAQALRRHLRCTLPVEVAYVGDKEVDNTTRMTLSGAFPPLHWLDLDSNHVKADYPAHQRKDYTMDRYEQKVFALYNSRFQQFAEKPSSGP
eukprot:gene3120-3398_t